MTQATQISMSGLRERDYSAMRAVLDSSVPAGHEGDADMYCLSPHCISHECQGYRHGWNQGRTELTDSILLAVAEAAGR
jgi:hypothetical protein